MEGFPSLWKDTGNVTNVPESEWMDIPLVDNWKEVYKAGQAKCTLLDRKIVRLLTEHLTSYTPKAGWSDHLPQLPFLFHAS